MSEGQQPATPQTNVVDVHYTELHTAIEQFRGVDIDGQLVHAQYPSEDVDQGWVKLTFGVVTTDDE